MNDYYKKIVITWLACFLFVLIAPPLFHVGDVYQSTPKNWNGYFVLQDEDDLIDLGFIYYENYTLPDQPTYQINPSYVLHLQYNHGITTDRYMFVSRYNYQVWVTKSNGSYYTSSNGTTGYYFAVLGNYIILPNNTSLTLDATNNYNAYICIMGVSNYESEE